MSIRSYFVLALWLSSWAASGSAQLASLVKDIGTHSAPGGSSPEFLGTASGTSFFTAYSPNDTQLLWSTHGTPESTRLVADGCPISCSDFYLPIANVGDRLFLASSPFSSGDTTTALLLATGSPPAAVPILVATESLQFRNLTYPGRTATLGGNLLFSARTPVNGAELYVTDGSSGSYTLLRQFAGTYDLAAMKTAGDVVYFWNYVDFGSPELWLTDGTAAGTRRVPIPQLLPQGEVGIGTESGALVFVAQDANGDEVWITDGSASGTRRLTDFADPAADIWQMAASPTRVFFYVEDLSFGQELWTTDGSTQGTHAVTAFGFAEPFGYAQEPNQLVAVGDRAYFLATTGLAAAQLWVTNESATTADPLAQICASPDCIYDQKLDAVGSQVFFIGYDSDHGGELWTTDGQPSGTHLLHDACPGPCEGLGTVMTTAGDRLSYVARSEDFNNFYIFVAEAPWETASALYDELRAAPRTDTNRIPSGVDDGEFFYFPAFDSSHGLEPWASRGTPATTFQLTDIVGPRPDGSYPSGFAANDETLTFESDDSSIDVSFWLTEGESATTRLASSEETFHCSRSFSIEPLGNLFVTLGCDPEFWVIDPISSQVRSLPAGSCYHQAGFGVVGGTAAAAYDCFPGIEIWRSDGTAQGTHLAMSIPDGFGILSAFFSVNGRFLLTGSSGDTRLYALSPSMTSLLPLTSAGVFPDLFVAPQGEPIGFFSRESRIWRTDGTAAGTFAIGPERAWLNLSSAVRSATGYDLVVHNDSNATEIWSTDGTAAGTVVRASIYPHYISLDQVPLERVGDQLFFLIDANPDGMFLWALPDGSTQPVRVHSASNQYLATRALARHGDRVYFAACDPTHGCELWVSDGTEAGTRMIHDISPGPASSGPRELLIAGDKLYFSADDGQHGTELWVLPLDGGAPCRANERQLCLEDSRFQVSARWTDFSGRSGDAAAVAITGDTGYFWFFDEDNVELILKLIDGGGYNGHHWVYYGALSNIEYTFTVTDSETGAAKRYFNPATRFASSGDITAFGPQGAHATGGGSGEEMARAGSPPEISLGASSAPRSFFGSCVPSATRFCILGNRFAVSATWRDFAGHTGTANVGTLTDDTGYFWFFDEDNVEVVLKMVDAGSFNQHFWVFYGALSNVEYTITVTDTVAGGPPRVYHNPLGQFGSFGDNEAFPAP